MSEDILNISVVNFYSIWGDPEQNLKRMVGYVKSAARTGAQIVVFPEMALTGYDIDETKEKGVPMQVQKAQTLSDMAGNAMSRIAHELDMYIFWGMPEKDKANPEQAYNVTAVAKPDGEVLSYRKIHLNPDEKSWAIPGNSPFLLETPWGLIGVAMCWEFYTHTEIIRYYASKGARMLINATAHCENHGNNASVKSLEAFVSHNKVFVASSNLVGISLKEDFTGGSHILGPSVNGIRECHYYAGHPFNHPQAKQAAVHSAIIDLSLATRDIYEPSKPDNKPCYLAEFYSTLY